MKKKLYPLALSFCLVSSVILTPINTISTTTVQAKATVYCVPKGHVYHSTRSCRTLRRSKNIKKISLKAAKAKGLRACKVCH